MPGVKIAIANPETRGQCADSHLGEIWVCSLQNASGSFTVFGEENGMQTDHFNARLTTGDVKTRLVFRIISEEKRLSKEQTWNVSEISHTALWLQLLLKKYINLSFLQMGSHRLFGFPPPNSIDNRTWRSARCSVRGRGTGRVSAIERNAIPSGRSRSNRFEGSQTYWRSVSVLSSSFLKMIRIKFD